MTSGNPTQSLSFEEIDKKIPRSTKLAFQGMPREKRAAFLLEINSKTPKPEVEAVLTKYDLSVEEVRCWFNHLYSS